MADEITDLLSRVQAEGVPLPAPAAQSLRKGLAAYGGNLGELIREELVETFLDDLRDIVQPPPAGQAAPGRGSSGQATPAMLVDDLAKVIERYEDSEEIIENLNLRFKAQIATEVMRGAGRFVSQNFDQAELDEFPALELLRVYAREVPRGFERGAKGALVPVPDDDWPSRWSDACEASGDDDAADVLQRTGRMVALKSSGVWEQLGTNRDDTLGNPYPPFAFNSGYDVNNIAYAEAVELGLLDVGDRPARAPVDWGNLFSLADR